MKRLGILVLLVLFVSIGLVFAGGILGPSSGSGSGSSNPPSVGCPSNNRCDKPNADRPPTVNCGQRGCAVETVKDNSQFTAGCNCPR